MRKCQGTFVEEEAWRRCAVSVRDRVCHGCGCRSGVPAERPEGVLKPGEPGEKAASAPHRPCSKAFSENQVSELLSRRRREVAATKTPEQIAERQKN